MNLTERPITVPANPFWKVFTTFGRDEFYAIVLSMLATGATMLALRIWPASEVTTAALLALAGPIFEKLGFFIGHIKDAREVYKTTLEKNRKSFRYYARQAFRGGLKSLIWDILVHDPIYVVLMFGGMYFNPKTPAWLLVPVAFGVAVVIVAVLDVGLAEIRYWLLKRKLTSSNFRFVPYFESRFVIHGQHDPELVFEDIADKFVADTARKAPRIVRYQDDYYKSNLPEYNGREAYLRFRKKTICFPDKSSQDRNSIQIVYIRTEEQAEQNPEQHRYFPQRKDKFHYVVEGPAIGFLTNPAVYRLLNLFGMRLTDKPDQVITFERRVCSQPDTMYVAVDTLSDGYFVLELKVYCGQANLLKQAMRYVMHKYRVIQTTHNKTSIQTVTLASG